MRCFLLRVSHEWYSPLFVGLCCTVACAPDDAARTRSDLLFPWIQFGDTRRVTEAEPNDTFDSAQNLSVKGPASTEIAGELAAPTDVDVFAIEPPAGGSRFKIIAHSRGAGSNDLRCAVFDEYGAVLASQSAESNAAGEMESLFEVGSRLFEKARFIAVASAPETGGSAALQADALWAYSIQIQSLEAEAGQALSPQAVWLEFGGGVADQFPQAFAREIPPFESERLPLLLRANTSVIITLIVDRLREQYGSYNIEFLRSDRDVKPAPPFTTLFFGSEDAGCLGRAQNVDWGNENRHEQAIIYSDNLAYLSHLDLSVQAAGVYLGNVAAHELGHLLGLAHTDDSADTMGQWHTPEEAMNTTMSFGPAPLCPDVFPLGWQNAAESLRESVGIAD